MIKEEIIICGDCGGREFTASLPDYYDNPSIMLKCIKCESEVIVSLSTEIDVTWPGKREKAA